jgi:DtxR family Mn-dependent transcriptional regulator
MKINERSSAVEDYLKTIYELNAADRRATTTELAAALKITPASVTGMLQKLAQETPPLVHYHKHHGVSLTAEGITIALETIRHHRLLESFLGQVLGYEWEALHEEADRLEHVLSDHLEERMARVLHNPTRDPHGAPIPDANLHMEEFDWVRMNTLREGQEAIIESVPDEDPGLLRYLASAGIKPQVRISVTAHSPYDQNLSIQIGDRTPVVLGSAITEQIMVERIQ